MSTSTPNFDLKKLQATDPYAIEEFNGNMDTIDAEMAKPPLTVNDIEPDEETRNIQIETVPLADNLTSDQAQINTGSFIVRSSGGAASISDEEAWLSGVRGNMVKNGYVAESLNMTVNPAEREEGVDPIYAEIDRDSFVAEVTSSGTITLLYTTDWSADPATYGITVVGTPIAGDQIVVVYVKGNRGTITTAAPTSFISTGWNLYNHAAGYARVVDYSNEYGYMIEGTYTKLEFAETLTGEKTEIIPVDGYFTIPSDGYVFVTGGNDTDTAIWMTWSDWTDEANDGVFEPYSQTSIDLSGVMVNFPNGLMRIGNFYDEINLNTQMAYSRIEKMEYTEENLAAVIASGVPYDTDTGYIYAVRTLPLTYSINLDGEYMVADHGIEMFLGTTIPVTAVTLYGNNLKNKLERDVLTISQQTLTAGQQAQVLENIGIANLMYNNRWLRFDPTNKKGLIIKKGATIPLKTGGYYIFTQDTAVDLTESSLVGGKDYLVYLSNNGVVSVSLTEQSTGTKIGRFHTLCADVGTINMTAPSSGLAVGNYYMVKPYKEDEDPDFYAFYRKEISAVTSQTYYDVVTVPHPLSGFTAGDILPESVFCLGFHPEALFDDAMVYDKTTDRAVDVYLQSGKGISTRSAYNETHTVSRQQNNHQSDMLLVGKRLLYDNEFASAALGSNERTAITGAADKTTVGGHVDTASRRMISAIGCEEMCGYLWQWLEDVAPAGGSGFSSTDGHGSFGQEYGDPYVLLAGGYWSNSSSCGSRCRLSNSRRSSVNGYSGGRGSSRILRQS